MIEFLVMDQVSDGYSIQGLLEYLEISYFTSELESTDEDLTKLSIKYSSPHTSEIVTGNVLIEHFNITADSEVEKIIKCTINIDQNYVSNFKDVNTSFCQDFKNRLKNYFIIRNARSEGEYFKKCVWLTDTQSKYISTELSFELYRLENKLRAMIEEFFTIKFGHNWSKIYARSYSGDRDSGIYKKHVDIFRNIDMLMNNLLTSEAMDIIGKEQIKLSENLNDSNFVTNEIEKLLIDAFNIDKKVGDGALREHLKKSPLFNREYDSLFTQYLSQYTEGGDRLLINRWESIVRLRNQIAHNKPLDIKFYNSAIHKFHDTYDIISEIIDQYRVELNQYRIEFPNTNSEQEVVVSSEETIEQEVVVSSGETTEQEVVVSSEETAEQEVVVSSEETAEQEVVISSEESSDDQYRYEEFDEEEFAELESGIEVLDREEIIEYVGESVNTYIDELFELLDEEPFGLVENNSFENDITLLYAKYKFNNEYYIKISSKVVNIDESRGGSSEFSIIFDIKSEEYVYTSDVSIGFINGDYEFNSEQCNYMPIVSVEIIDGEFQNEMKKIYTNLNHMFPDLLSFAEEKYSSYSYVKSGGVSEIFEECCPNCGDFATVCSDEEIFAKCNEEWDKDVALCLSCMEKCDIIEDDHGYLTIS